MFDVVECDRFAGLPDVELSAAELREIAEFREWLAVEELPNPARDLGAAVAGFHAAVGALVAATGSATLVPTAAVLDALARIELGTNRLAAVDARLVGTLDDRDAAAEFGERSTARLVGSELQLRPVVAHARVVAARVTGPRTSLLGEVLPPVRAHLAAAQEQGGISADHAAVIRRALEQLPAATSPDVVDRLEEHLVGFAHDFDPQKVAALARHALAVIDPDGIEPREDVIARQAGVTVRHRDDGSGHLNGTLTPECLAAVEALFDSLAAPKPTTHGGPDGGPDLRSAARRNHDALQDAALRLLGSDTLPRTGGAAATMLVRVDLETLEQRTGLVSTTHGGTISLSRLLELGCEIQTHTIICSKLDGVVAYGRARRFATDAQTLALIARDGGCAWPRCDQPAAWTERHHQPEWHDGGRTDLDAMLLLCDAHHDKLPASGWTIHFHNGRPWFTPPPEVDPEQKPRRNTHWDNPGPDRAARPRVISGAPRVARSGQ